MASVIEPIRILTWNVERLPRSRRGAVEARLVTLDYDIAILTETRIGFVHETDVLAPGDPPEGRFAANERKVAIWSRWGWGRPEPGWDGAGQGSDAAEPVPDGLPASRFVAGTTHTPGGPLRVVGICVPYRFHRVRHAAPDGERRRVWEEHLGFLEALTPALRPGATPQVVAGDFNQRVPPVGRLDPVNAVHAREAAMAGHAVLTQDLLGTDHRLLLCHVASTVPAAEPASVVDRHDEAGHALSDHHGAVVSIQPGGSPAIVSRGRR